MTIEFNDSEYRWTYGKAPKGLGTWAFKFEGHEFFAHGTYAEAKKACKNEIKRLAPKDYDGFVSVKVLT